MSQSKSFVADIAWVRRGLAKRVPEKIEIEKEDLENLLGKGNDELFNKNQDSDDEDKEHDASELADGLEKYKLDEYDDAETDDALRAPGMKGLAYYASPLEDPYLTRQQDSDEEEEREDFEIKENDNLVVCAKIIKDDPTLEVWLFNEDADDWYLHHDYILDAPPLCLAPFSYDPGSDDKTGNLIAVGTMDSIIHVYDLDIINAMEPVLSLGHSSIPDSNKSKKKKRDGEAGESSNKGRKKRDGSAQFHTDAVLTLDWNRLAQHVLASGSADESIILWDLDQAKPATVLTDFNGMIQSLQWHPVEESIILSGTRKGQIRVTDCRSAVASSLTWSTGTEHEIEKVVWNRFNPFCFFACSSDGKLQYMDTRKPGSFLCEIIAHEGGTNDVSQSFKVKGLLTTVGDKELKIWKLDSNEQIMHVYTHQINMGTLNIGKFSPDSGNVIVIGAESEELVRIVDLSKFPEIVANFNKSSDEMVAETE